MDLEFDPSNIAKNVSVATEYFKAYYSVQYANEVDENNKITKQKFSGGTNGFIPFNIEFTVDGIAGMKIYNQLTINTSFLPNGYTKTTDFIITGIDHKLNNNDWVTNIKTTLIPKFQDSDKVITAQNFLSSIFKKSPPLNTPPSTPPNNIITSSISLGDQEQEKWSLIPDGMNSNYRSGQLPEEDIENYLTTFKIKYIVRMNGDGSDTDNNFTRAKEEKIAKNLGIEFIFIGAHEGSNKDENGYQTSRTAIIKALNKGNTWIHCHAGADRTGYAVASHIQSKGVNNDGFLFNHQTIPATGKPWTYEELMDYSFIFNNWDGKIKDKEFENTGYARYANTFWPASLREQTTTNKKYYNP